MFPRVVNTLTEQRVKPAGSGLLSNAHLSIPRPPGVCGAPVLVHFSTVAFQSYVLRIMLVRVSAAIKCVGVMTRACNCRHSAHSSTA